MKIFECKAHPEFKIVAQSYETRTSWGHKAYLVNDNNYTLNEYKITYYNRTWECYQYQSVIKSVLYDYMTRLINDYINNYKQQNSIKRLTNNKREELIKQVKQTPLFEKINTFYGEL